MAIKYSFVDSSLYGTEDINDITRCLTGAGVMPFTSKDSYNLSDLNALTSALVGAGTELEGCKVSALNTGTMDMAISVAPGIIFFESGVRMEIDKDGYAFGITPNTRGYVFAHFSPALQKAEILFETELSGDGECVVLAMISDDGKIRDERKFARAKVATMGKNVTRQVSFAEISPKLVDLGNSQRTYIMAKADDIELSKFNYALVFSPELERYELLDLNTSDSSVYLGMIYSYGPANYARVVDNRLCVIQTGYDANEKPALSNNMLSNYNVILV